MARFVRTIGRVSTKADYFDHVSDDVRAKLREVIERRANEMADKARSLAPKGRKGRVIKSIKVKVSEDSIHLKGVIYSSHYVARFWELGFGGETVRVKAHLRRVKSQDVKAKVANAKGQMRSKLVSKGQTEVAAHDRAIPHQQKSFMKVAFDQLREETYRELRSTYLSESSRSVGKK